MIYWLIIGKNFVLKPQLKQSHHCSWVFCFKLKQRQKIWIVYFYQKSKNNTVIFLPTKMKPLNIFSKFFNPILTQSWVNRETKWERVRVTERETLITMGQIKTKTKHITVNKSNTLIMHIVYMISTKFFIRYRSKKKVINSSLFEKN